MNIYQRIVLILGAIALISISCSPMAKKNVLENINLNMTKSEVKELMPIPPVIRGSMINKYNQYVDIWEYELVGGVSDVLGGRSTLYRFYFYDNRLVRWGVAGEWQREADRIYEIRFR